MYYWRFDFGIAITLNKISVHIAFPWVIIGSLSGSLPSQQSSSTQRHPANRTWNTLTYIIKLGIIWISSLRVHNMNESSSLVSTYIWMMLLKSCGQYMHIDLCSVVLSYNSSFVILFSKAYCVTWLNDLNTN